MGSFKHGFDPNRAKTGTPGRGVPKLRDTTWLRQECQKLVDKHQLLDFLADVARGAYKQVWVTLKGVEVMRPVDALTRMKATEMLLDRGYGKPTQDMQLSGTVGGKMIITRPNNGKA